MNYLSGKPNLATARSWPARFTMVTPRGPEIASLLRLDATARRYEEDPYTGDWTTIAPTRIVGQRSRFEFDLNRPREKAVYLAPADCWGLDVWKSPPPPDVVHRSLAEYDDFYAHVRICARTARCATWPRRRLRPAQLQSHSRRCRTARRPTPAENPEINLGTRSMDRTYWNPIVDRWLAEMREYDYLGRSLDVRENVKFFGGHFPTWIHRELSRHRVCAGHRSEESFSWTSGLASSTSKNIRRLDKRSPQAAVGVSDELENWQHARPVA